MTSPRPITPRPTQPTQPRPGTPSPMDPGQRPPTRPRITDDELPGMWEVADLIGGETDNPLASGRAA